VTVVAVTGSDSGMGAATAALLRARGCRVIGVDLHGAEVEADLSLPDGRHAAINSVADLAGGRLDGVALFAGVSGFAGRPGSQVVSVDYFGAVEILAGLRPCLAAAPSAAAVAVSSNAATTAPGLDEALIAACLRGDEPAARDRADAVGGPGSYAAAKLALARWVRRASTTPEWIGAGIALNAIAPGQVDTPLVAEMRADPIGRAILDRAPLPAGRAGRAEEIAALTAFLLSADAAFIVGSVVYVDGGTDAYVRPDDWPAVRARRVTSAPEQHGAPP
jgi:NAD(P)-dependent dehydrogenase (short-subunit alcohol dehydrogenase family)